MKTGFLEMGSLETLTRTLVVLRYNSYGGQRGTLKSKCQLKDLSGVF